MRLIKQIMASIGTLLSASTLFAEEMGHVASSTGDNTFLGYVAIGAGIGMGLAAMGGAAGQGKAASAALDGIARNPSSSGKMLLPLLLSLALMESLVIFTFLVTNGMAGTIGKALGL